MDKLNKLSPTGAGFFIATIFLAILISGCATPDSFARRHHVGDTYEVVGNLCIAGDRLKDEETTDLKGWQIWAEKFHSEFEKLPLGSRIKIESIKKETRWSWNTGTYSYYVVLVSVPPRTNRYDGSHLIYGVSFGDNGKNLVTLKKVNDTSPNR